MLTVRNGPITPEKKESRVLEPFRTTETVETSSPESPMVMPTDEEWVTLDLKLLNWKFLDFKHRVRTTTHIFTIKNLLLEHHGRVADLILCKGSFTEANELPDEMKTLEEYGVTGAPRGAETPVTVPLFYDFKPVAYDEPLLLVYWVMRTKQDGYTSGVISSKEKELQTPNYNT